MVGLNELLHWVQVKIVCFVCPGSEKTWDYNGVERQSQTRWLQAMM